MTGTLTYTLPLTQPSAAQCGKLETAIRSAARTLVSVPPHASTALAYALSRMPTADALLTSAACSFVKRLELLSSYPLSSAARMLRALKTEPRRAATRHGAAPNMYHALTDRLAAATASGVVTPPCDRYVDVAGAAHVLSRAIAYRDFQHLLREPVPSAAVAGRDITRISLPPNSTGSTRHAAALYFGTPATQQQLGTAHDCHTPVSIVYPQ